MPTASTASPEILEAQANNSRRFSCTDRRSSLTDCRLSLLDRPQSTHEYSKRRKSAENERYRNSWRWSWKNVLTRPFQNHRVTLAASIRGKGKTPKKMSSEQLRQVSTNSVEARKKMDNLLSLWHTEIVDSSDESSDDYDESLLRGRRRSCSPRVIGNESSTSEEEDDSIEVISLTPVSLYASEGPSSMVFSANIQEEETSEGVPNSSEADPTHGTSNSTSNNIHESFLQRETDYAAGHLNSNLRVLTGLHDMNKDDRNNIVISPLQICHHERYNDCPKQVKHFAFISSERCNSNRLHVAGESKEKKSSEEVLDKRNTLCPSWVGSTTICNGNPQNSKAKAEGNGLGLNSPREPCLEGTIEIERKDFLSAQLQNKHLKSGEEELIKEPRNEDSLAEIQVREEQADKQLCSATEMEDLFSTQDLQAIRRFLGMSLQQIDANKVFSESGSVEPTKDVVPDYPSTYSKNGGETNEILPQDEKDVCELQCQFKGFGCPFPGTRSVLELGKHTQSSVAEHLKLVSKTVEEQKEQLRDQRLLQEKQGVLIRQLTDTVRNLKDLVQEQEKKNHSQEKVVLSLKDQLKEHRKQNQRFERDTSLKFQTLSQSTISNTCSSPAEMLWPIKNFTKRLRRVREGEVQDPLISEPFYTGPYGYKLAIWIYLNGRGKNLGSCVSVYARVMPGEHDATLSWPVRPVYTFTVFDQSEGERQNIVRTRKVNDIKRDGGKRNGIDRPGGGDRSVIVGFDDFIAHDQLERRNYLAGDCFFIKLEAKFLQ